MRTNKVDIELLVNGERRFVSIRPAETLLTVLREYLGLTGAKPGCENGDCGACTILLDSWPFKSCIMLAVEASGYEITTIEGLSDTPIQYAFIEKNAFQCGYCTSGFILNCTALIEQKPDASEVEIERWLESNICRCTGYAEIREAICSVLNK